MNMKEHILAAMREQLDRWEELLSRLSEAEVVSPNFDLDWSIKDVMAHLWAWQQISIARMEGGLESQEPNYPQWIVESIENWEDDSDRINALTFDKFHEKSWSDIYQSWKHGYIRFLDLGNQFSEPDLLAGGKYPWLNGYSLAFILIASYDHHQEHFDKLKKWLKEQ
jgi:hypothetical protein